MGVRLDWEIETEDTTSHKAGEDATTRRRRRMALLRLVLSVGLMLGVVAAAGWAVWARLQAINDQYEAALADTVAAEVAALRLSDRNAYMAIQRSANEDWVRGQGGLFSTYQALKEQDRVVLTGRVLDVTVDGPRGRVLVEEIIDDVPFTQLWFYWRYEEGWRHVPPDVQFWGVPGEIARRGLTVRYASADAAFANAMAAQVEGWLRVGCTVLACSTPLPPVTIEVLPDPALAVGWRADAPWTLAVPSPLLGRMRQDQPFSAEPRLAVAAALASRLVAHATSDLEPVYPYDAYYLVSGLESWLIGRFAASDTASHLWSSYANRYGEPAVGRAVRAVGRTSTLDVLASPAGVGRAQDLAVDWRDWLTWRLVLESELLAAGDAAAFASLYDAASQPLAAERFARRVAPVQPLVISAQATTLTDGSTGLRATVQTALGQEVMLFRWQRDTWLRAN